MNSRVLSRRSTNLDSWTPEQLKMMSFGGNNRAQVFFKQHGWTDGGKIEAKYTSRAADLYRQILSKEVAKSMAEEAGLPSSPISSSSAQASLSDIKTNEPPKENSLGKQEIINSSATLKAPHAVVSSTVKKPLGAKKVVKTSGLGARKLTTKVDKFFWVPLLLNYPGLIKMLWSILLDKLRCFLPKKIISFNCSQVKISMIRSLRSQLFQFPQQIVPQQLAYLLLHALNM